MSDTNVKAAFFFHFWPKSMTTGRKEVYPEEQCLKRGVSLSSDNCKQACWYFLNITNLKYFSRYTGKRDDEQIRALAIQHHGLASHVHWVGSISFPCPEAFPYILHFPLSLKTKLLNSKFNLGKQWTKSHSIAKVQFVYTLCDYILPAEHGQQHQEINHQQILNTLAPCIVQRKILKNYRQTMSVKCFAGWP